MQTLVVPPTNLDDHFIGQLLQHSSRQMPRQITSPIEVDDDGQVGIIVQQYHPS
jgi:hypothetical protein